MITTRKSLLLFVLAALVVSSCGWNEGRYKNQVDKLFDEVDLIQFDFVKPYGNKLNVRDEHQITEIKNWLLDARPPESVGSYPDTLIPVSINNKSGVIFSFSISPPLENIRYTVIRWNDQRLIGKKLPIEVEELKRSSIDPQGE